MSDYISRDAAKKQMRNGRHSMEWLLASGAKTIGDAFAIVLDEVPAADVRPVVLCRDCMHYEMGVCLKIYDDGAANKDAWQERKPDDFCSYGEDRNAPTNWRTNMQPTSMSGANEEGKRCMTKLVLAIDSDITL